MGDFDSGFRNAEEEARFTRWQASQPKPGTEELRERIRELKEENRRLKQNQFDQNDLLVQANKLKSRCEELEETANYFCKKYEEERKAHLGSWGIKIVTLKEAIK